VSTLDGAHLGCMAGGELCLCHNLSMFPPRNVGSTSSQERHMHTFLRGKSSSLTPAWRQESKLTPPGLKSKVLAFCLLTSSIRCLCPFFFTANTAKQQNWYIVEAICCRVPPKTAGLRGLDSMGTGRVRAKKPAPPEASLMQEHQWILLLTVFLKTGNPLI